MVEGEEKLVVGIELADGLAWTAANDADEDPMMPSISSTRAGST
jgi:hypothetical protein